MCARAAAGPPRTAAQEAANAVAEVAEAGAHLDVRTRTQLLRCLANLCLNDATHEQVLRSATSLDLS